MIVAAQKKQPAPARLGGDSEFTRFHLAPAFTGTKKTPKFEKLPFPTAADGSDPVLTALIKRLGGNRELAKRIMSLAEKFPVATVPELICYSWLMAEGLRFDFQIELFGGRRFEGGLLPDFVVHGGNAEAIVFQIQGQFWHSIARKGFHDQTSQWRMLGQIVNGSTISKVVEIFEDDLYMGRHVQTLFYALAGISLRGVGGF